MADPAAEVELNSRSTLENSGRKDRTARDRVALLRPTRYRSERGLSRGCEALTSQRGRMPTTQSRADIGDRNRSVMHSVVPGIRERS